MDKPKIASLGPHIRELVDWPPAVSSTVSMGGGRVMYAEPGMSPKQALLEALRAAPRHWGDFIGDVEKSSGSHERKLQGNRVALVIGNADYRHTEALVRTTNDARTVAANLQGAGFEVIELENAERRTMVRALRTFGEKLASADMGLFCYAGRGLHAQGASYLLPVDASVTPEDDIAYEALSVRDVVRRMNDAGVRLGLVLIDAAETTTQPGAVGGAAEISANGPEAQLGTVIACAAAPNGAVVDVENDNQMYSAALLEAVSKPGMDMAEVFERVAHAVEQRLQAK